MSTDQLKGTDPMCKAYLISDTRINYDRIM